jgi:hypothetical protein
MMRVLEKRVLRKICRPKRDKVRGEWRRLYREGLYDLYSQIFFRVVTSRRMKKNERRMACSTMGEKTDA